VSEQRPGHPSGRPIDRRRVKQLGFTRRPNDEPLTPGLRKGVQTYAVGFRASIAADDDDE